MSESESTPLTQDEAYDLLSNARRRFVISYLRERGDPVDIMQLSRTVAAWENETDPEDLTDQQVKRVYVSLYQTHIPKLDDAGIVDYDPDDGHVELTGVVRELDTFLPGRDEDDRTWQKVYLALAILGLAFYVFAMAFSIVPLSVLGIVLLLLFGVLAATQYVAARRA